MVLPEESQSELRAGVTLGRSPVTLDTWTMLPLEATMCGVQSWVRMKADLVLMFINLS